MLLIRVKTKFAIILIKKFVLKLKYENLILPAKLCIFLAVPSIKSSSLCSTLLAVFSLCIASLTKFNKRFDGGQGGVA